MSNHLLVQLQRQHVLLSYFKTLSVGPVWGKSKSKNPGCEHMVLSFCCVRSFNFGWSPEYDCKAYLETNTV